MDEELSNIVDSRLICNQIKRYYKELCIIYCKNLDNITNIVFRGHVKCSIKLSSDAENCDLEELLNLLCFLIIASNDACMVKFS